MIERVLKRALSVRARVSNVAESNRNDHARSFLGYVCTRMVVHEEMYNVTTINVYLETKGNIIFQHICIDSYESEVKRI